MEGRWKAEGDGMEICWRSCKGRKRHLTIVLLPHRCLISAAHTRAFFFEICRRYARVVLPEAINSRICRQCLPFCSAFAFCSYFDSDGQVETDWGDDCTVIYMFLYGATCISQTIILMHTVKPIGVAKREGGREAFAAARTGQSYNGASVTHDIHTMSIRPCVTLWYCV